MNIDVSQFSKSLVVDDDADAALWGPVACPADVGPWEAPASSRTLAASQSFTEAASPIPESPKVGVHVGIRPRVVVVPRTNPVMQLKASWAEVSPVALSPLDSSTNGLTVCNIIFKRQITNLVVSFVLKLSLVVV